MLTPEGTPKHGSAMKIVSLIERHQTEGFETILQHCGLRAEGSARGPPAAEESLVV
ncbi:MAG: hypothetical protein AB9869_36055 [Verrucomicrobiia bacterium]